VTTSATSVLRSCFADLHGGLLCCASVLPLAGHGGAAVCRLDREAQYSPYAARPQTSTMTPKGLGYRFRWSPFLGADAASNERSPGFRLLGVTTCVLGLLLQFEAGGWSEPLPLQWRLGCLSPTMGCHDARIATGRHFRPGGLCRQTTANRRAEPHLTRQDCREASNYPAEGDVRKGAA
jgi:hypothetical protein